MVSTLELQVNVCVSVAGMVDLVPADVPLVLGGRHVTRHVAAVTTAHVMLKMVYASVIGDGLEPFVIRLAQLVFMAATVNTGETYLID